jgi:hypothetical protein
MSEGAWAAIAAIIVGIMTVIGNIAVSVSSQKKTNEFTDYKINEIKDQVKGLEEKQDKHNKVIERTFKLEEHVAVIDEQIKVANHRIADLENIKKK